jgi:LPS-assembly lipoprotein
MRAILTFAFALLLAGCGFQLRGTAELPFDTIYMPPANAPGVLLDLRRNITTGTHTTVIDDPKKATAVLEFTQETREKVILSLNAAGRVSEYQLRYRVGFRVHDGKGGEFVPARTVQATREITFNDSDVLSKETEEQLMYRDMQRDMVQQIMRLLAAAHPPKPAVQ